MELVRFHKLRRAVQSNASPGTHRELREVLDNVRWTLDSSGLFQDVEVEATDDIDKLVVAMCTFSSDLCEADVAQRLEQVWEERMRFQFWEAHATLVDFEQVELEGATRTSTAGHYVTVHIVAQKAPIPAQRQPVEKPEPMDQRQPMHQRWLVQQRQAVN